MNISEVSNMKKHKKNKGHFQDNLWSKKAK